MVRQIGGAVACDCIDWRYALDGGLDDLLEECDEPIVLCGWSLGGQLALEAYHRVPASVGCLILVSSMSCLAKGDSRPGLDPSVGGEIAKMIQRSRRGYLRPYFADCLAPLEDPELQRSLLEEAEQFSIDDLLRGLSHMFDTEADPQVEVPMMVIHDQMDSIIPFECGIYVKEENCGASSVALKDNGHLLPLTAPGLVADAIVEFLHDCTS